MLASSVQFSTLRYFYLLTASLFSKEQVATALVSDKQGQYRYSLCISLSLYIMELGILFSLYRSTDSKGSYQRLFQKDALPRAPGTLILNDRRRQSSRTVWYRMRIFCGRFLYETLFENLWAHRSEPFLVIRAVC